ncbi:hypothetical protein P154DRAFT_522577 [Amniculicola lignicola CBS 123094]|uniref:Thioesterase/thiol ester dehydrase-isomerase n=1 Tax=Amniculicola lignicola CBS 123094 TaxID=1392246 RepID=A0A6A5WHV1_9PLEO|nr:hypothetical protein P154DRAFT_522577 [Amniculicola lignicola CBS 123094]
MRRQFLRQLFSPPTSTTYGPGFQRITRHARYASTHKGKNEPVTASLNPRWLSNLRTRIGKCIMFGLTTEQAQEAGTILQEIAADWRGLVAGSEGFLTEENRRGLYRQGVVWGEMDSMGHVNNVTYVRYAESARCNWALNYANVLDPAHKANWKALLTSKDIGLILRSIKVDYKFVRPTSTS